MNLIVFMSFLYYYNTTISTNSTNTTNTTNTNTTISNVTEEKYCNLNCDENNTCLIDEYMVCMER